jgi:hypothetical protein
MIRSWVKTAIFLFAVISVFGCDDSKRTGPTDWVIVSGQDTVTAFEFERRFTSSAVPGSGLASKVDYARAILVEHILARKADSLQLDTSNVAKRLLLQMENEALVQTFLARRVDARIEITEEMLRDQFYKMNRHLLFDAWVFRDSSDAFSAFETIVSGTSFRRAATADPHGSRVFLPAQPLRYGQASPLFEDIAYSMDLNDVCEPFYNRGRWWILHLTHFEQTRVPSEAAFASAAPTLRGTILRRLRGPEQREYIGEIMKGAQIEFEPSVVKRLAVLLEPSLARDTTGRGNAPNTLVQPRVGILAELADKSWLDEPLMTFHGKDTWSWSARDVVERLAVMPQPLVLGPDESPRSLLRRVLIYLTEFETLTQQARADGLLSDPEVVFERKMWQRHVLAVRARQYFAALSGSSNSPDTLQRYLDAHLLQYPERVHSRRLREMKLTDLPVFVAKTHFPLRLATPTPAGLDLIFGQPSGDAGQND